MASDDPAYLPVGTEVSAKYRGAFCEAKVKKIVKLVKCKLTVKDTNAHVVGTDADLMGEIKVGGVVGYRQSDGSYVEAIVTRVTDNSTYTVVFNDGDENTLRRTQCCLKGQKHFMQTDTLDQLPLTHPEHFGTPVMKPGRKRLREPGQEYSETDDDSITDDDSTISERRRYPERLSDMIGRIGCIDVEERKKTLVVPVLVVDPNADEVPLPSKESLLVRSFKDNKFFVVAKKDLKEFNVDMAAQNEEKSLKLAYSKALAFYQSKELPSGWDKEGMLGSDLGTDGESDSSDNEQDEEKDRFVAQLHKFMDDRGTPINKGPFIGNRDLDLYKLFKVVQNVGGYNKVTNQMKWKQVYIKMNLPGAATASTLIKNAYKKYLHAFEDFYRKLGNSMGTITRPSRSRHGSGRSIMTWRERESPKSSPRSLDKADDVSDKVSRGIKESIKQEMKPDSDCETESPRKGRSAKIILDEKRLETPAKPSTRENTARLKQELKQNVSDNIKANKKEEVLMKKETTRITRKDDTEAKDSKTVKTRELLTGKLAKPSPAARLLKDDAKTGDAPPTAAAKSKLDDKRSKKGKDCLEIEQEEPKKRGRKRMIKAEDDLNKKGDAEKDDDAEPPKTRQGKGEMHVVGTKLKIKYGKGRNQKTYEAKVVEAGPQGNGYHYLVHYAGWNTRYDEWVGADRVVQVVSTPSPSAATPVLPSKKSKMNVWAKKRAGRTISNSSNNSTTSKSSDIKVPAPKVKAGPSTPSNTRLTRQSSQDIIGPPSKRRKRTTSAVVDEPEKPTAVSDSEDSDISVGENKVTEIPSTIEKTQLVEEVKEKDGKGAESDETEPAVDDSKSDEEDLAVEEGQPEDSKDRALEKQAAEEAESVGVDEQLEDSLECKEKMLADEKLTIQHKFTPTQLKEEIKDEDLATPLDEAPKLEPQELENKIPDESLPTSMPTISEMEEPVGKDMIEAPLATRARKAKAGPKLKKQQLEYKEDSPKVDVEEGNTLENLIKSTLLADEAKDSTSSASAEAASLKKTPGRRKKGKVEEVQSLPEVSKLDLEKKKKPEPEKKSKAKKVVRKKKEEGAKSPAHLQEEVRSSSQPIVVLAKKENDSSSPSKAVKEESSNVPDKAPDVELGKDAALPAEHSASVLEAASVLQSLTENTPPDTPDRLSATSVGSTSPRAEEDSAKSCSDPEAEAEIGEQVTLVSKATSVPSTQNSPHHCDMSTISNSSGGSSGNIPSSESSTECPGHSQSAVTASSKRRSDTQESLAPSKRRRRGQQKEKPGKTTPKHLMSDSDDASNADTYSSRSPNSGTPSKGRTYANPTSNVYSPTTVSLEKPPQTRPQKFNFNIEQGMDLEGEARIQFLMDKMNEIRKLYMNLKSEVACIDRRRKRHRRKEKEAAAQALHQMGMSLT